MGNYVGSFGLTRFVGAGEGRDELCDAVAKPTGGVKRHIEVVVDEKGPVENDGAVFGRGAAKVPAGSALISSVLMTHAKGSTSSVVLTLVKKDGTDAQALDTCTISADDTVVAKDLSGTVYADDRYVKATGARPGYKGTLIIEYI